MRVELFVAISADGFIARNDSELVDWSSKEDKKYFVGGTKRVGTMVVGRKTFETFPGPLPGRRTIVMTRNPQKSDTKMLEYTSETPAEIVARLDDEGIEGLAVCGGGQIYEQFLNAGLVDVCHVTVEDVNLEDGLRFVENVDGEFEYLSSEYLSDVTSVHDFVFKPS